MAPLRHIDFEAPGWAEFQTGPTDRPGYAATVLARQPVAYWRLGETSGATFADIAGGHDAPVGANVELGATGALALDDDPAARWPANAQGSEVLDGAAFERDRFSVLLWARPDAILDRLLLTKSPSPTDLNPGKGFVVRTDTPSDTVFMKAATTTGVLAGAAVPVSVGVWRMLAFSYAWDGDRSVLTTFADGEPFGDVTSTEPIDFAGTGSLWIAPHGPNFEGTLDELAILPVAIGAADVRDLYEKAVGR